MMLNSLFLVHTMSFDKDFYGVVPDEGSDVDGYVAAEKLLGLC